MFLSIWFDVGRWFAVVGGMFGLLMYAIISFANSDILTSFIIRISLISFSCLIGLARTSSIILKRGE